MARGDSRGIQVHLLERVSRSFMAFAACGNAGGRFYHQASLFRVTLASSPGACCKLCVRALSKRERETRRKARAWFKRRALASPKRAQKDRIRLTRTAELACVLEETAPESVDRVALLGRLNNPVLENPLAFSAMARARVGGAVSSEVRP